MRFSEGPLPFRRGFHDRGEAARIETGAANQCAVDVRLAHQIVRVFRFHAPAILDSNFVGGPVVGYFSQGVTDERVRFLCLLRGRDPTGADRPDWLVSDYRFLQVLFAQTFEAAAELAR